MADVYSAIILDDDPGGQDWWDGTNSWAGETTEGNRDTKFSTRRFTSISAWEADRDGNSSGGDDEHGIIIGPWSSADSSQTIISGWNADSAYLECPLVLVDTQDNPARHDGIYGNVANAYRLELSNTSYILLLDWPGGIDGLQIYNSNTGNSAQCIRVVEDVTVENCVIKSVGGGGALVTSDVTVDINIFNCVIFCDVSQHNLSEGIFFDNSSSANIYNCTVYNFNDGIERDTGTVIGKNIAVFNNADDFDGVYTLDYNASDDGDDPQTTGNMVDWDNEATDWALNFTDYANGDYTPLNVDLPGAGVGPSTDANVPTTDIIGNARSGTTCTIGAFEYVSAGESYLKYIAESIGLTEVVSRNRSMKRLIFATEGLQENVLRPRGMIRYFAEGIDLLEVAKRSISFKRTINESIDIIESIATKISTQIKKFINETVGLIETTYRKSALKRIVESTIDIVESSKPVRAINRKINETINIIRLELLGIEEYTTIYDYDVGWEEFVTSGLDITNARNVSGSAVCSYNEGLDSEKIYKITFDFIKIQGGANYRFASNADLTSGVVLSEPISVTGSYTFYSLGADFQGWYISSGSGRFGMYNLSIREVTESLGIRAVRALKRIISSVVDIIEGVAHLKAMKRAISATIGLIESISTQTSVSIKKFINETVGIIDGISTHISTSIKKIISEAVGITEAILRKSVLKRIISEIIDLSESVFSARTIKRILSSTIGIIESLVKPVAGELAKIINETIDLIESVSRKISIKRILSETVSLVESISTHISATLVKAISEVVGIVDSINTHISAILKKIINETVDIAESINSSISAALKKFISEVINLTETITRKRTLKRILSESVNIIEGIVYPRALKRIISATVELISAIKRTRAINRKLIATVDIIESVLRKSVIVRIINESISIIESIAKDISLAFILLVEGVRRIFTMDTLRRVFTKDISRRIFKKDTERRDFDVD